jgi:hypothetical protein
VSLAPAYRAAMLICALVMAIGAVLTAVGLPRTGARRAVATG